MHNFLKDDYNLAALTEVSPNGDSFTMFVTPRFAPVYATGYEALSTRIAKNFLTHKDLFVDVGAHYGYYSLLAANTSKATKIIAVEPIDENFKILQLNLEHNKVGHDRAVCIKAAVSSKGGRVEFCKSEASDNGSIYAHPSSETIARIEVATVCLDDLLAKEDARSIFIKTDTDGHEMEVLKGLEKTLRNHNDVSLLMELNPKMARIAGTSSLEIINHLHEKGFSLFAIDDAEARFYPLDNAMNVSLMESRYEKSYYNVLCIRKTKALSVLFFSHASTLTGAERSLLDLIRGLSERGVLCTAVLPSPGPLRGELVKYGCVVYVPSGGRLQEMGWCWASNADQTFGIAQQGVFDVAINVIVPEVRRLSPNVVFSQTVVSPWGALTAELLGIPHALSAREYGELDQNLLFALGFKQSMAALYDTSDAVFCITHDVQDTLFADDIDKKTDVVYSHLRLPCDEYNDVVNAEGKEAHKAGNPVTTIGIFGTISPGKNQGDLIRACLDLLTNKYEIRCVLAGYIADNSYADALKQEIETSGYSDRFVWTGFINNPYETMRNVGIIVSCSKKEALGRTLIEGVLVGKPIIYANAGGPREIFENNKHGLAYEVNDYQGLSNAIKSIISDPAAAKMRAQNAKKYVLQRFSDEVYAGKIYARLKWLANQPGRSDKQKMAVSKLLIASIYGRSCGDIMQPRIYYSDAINDFTEKQTLLLPEIPFGPFDLAFDLPAPGYTCLRFDPTEIHAVTLIISSLRVVSVEGGILAPEQIVISSNGERIGELSWRFRTLDPYVALELKAGAKKINLIGELKKVSMSQLIVDVDSLIAVREGQLTDLSQAVTERDGQVSQLTRVVGERDGHIGGLTQAAAVRDSQMASLTQAVAERDGQVSQLNRVVAERDGQVGGLTQAVAVRDSQVASLTQAVAERDGQVSQLNRIVAERDGQIGGLTQAVAVRDSQVVSFIQAVTERDGQVSQLSRVVAERDGHIGGLTQAVAERDGQLANLNQVVMDRERTLSVMVASRSWRLTKPLRVMVGFIWNTIVKKRLPHNFDPVMYLKLNPDVAAIGVDPAKHYINHGCDEGRLFAAKATSSQEHPADNRLPHNFDPVMYLKLNPDVAEAGVDPAMHYINHGCNEGRHFTVPENLFFYLAALRRTGGIKSFIVNSWSVFKEKGFCGLKIRLFKLYMQTTSPNDYRKWVRLYDTLNEASRKHITVKIEAMPRRPKISIVMPVYDPPLRLLDEAIWSIRRQLYPEWELCIADDASKNKAVRRLLKRHASKEPRIRVIFRTENGHISRASNSAMELATGEFIALMDNDDLLPAHALFYVAETILAKPEVALIYSDEDKISLSGERTDPYFKCDWNPDLFRSHNMISHLGVYRTDLVKEIGGFRAGFEGSQDYDLAARVIERISPDQIVHIPRVLYHWRILPGSTALSGTEKNYASIAGVRTLNEHFSRTKVAARAELLDFGMYRVRYAIPTPQPLVSLIIPTRNGLHLLKRCVDSILFKTVYKNYEIIIVDNGSDDQEILRYFGQLAENKKVHLLRDDSPFNYSALNNVAVKKALGTYVGLINNDLEVISPEWLDEMVGIAIQPGVGAVGARLWYPDNTLQHGGVITGLLTLAGHAHKKLPRGQFGYFARACITQSVSAVTGACLVIKKSTYNKVGGLDEKNLKVAFNDVDFCLKVRQAGYRNVWTPYAELYHHESASRGQEDTPEKKRRFQQEILHMHTCWGELLRSDPAYSLNLTLDREDFSLAWPPRVTLHGVDS